MINIFLLLFACSDGGKEDDSANTTDSGTQEVNAQDEFIYVETTPTGDMTCFAEGYSDSWATQNLAEDVSQNVPITGAVIDFETDEPVEEASIEVFWVLSVYRNHFGC